MQQPDCQPIAERSSDGYCRCLSGRGFTRKTPGFSPLLDRDFDVFSEDPTDLSDLIHEPDRDEFENSSAVIMLDVDELEVINDQRGHPVGDEVLEQLLQSADKAERLSKRRGEGHILAHPEDQKPRRTTVGG